MNHYLSIALLIFIVVILVYSTYSFSQGRFMEGLSVVPALVGCYFLVMFLQKRQDNNDEDE
jgi:ABC-type transport system involved in cytochrome c biogenesis permease subunit